MNVMDQVLQYSDEMISIRRYIHQNPELSYQEFNTTALIREKLIEYGIEIVEVGLKTGVVGILYGKEKGKTVAIREDIDALPMAELTELSYASKVDGVCHSCGHDIHTTTLLYCAKVLAGMKDELCGNVMFLFQPAEEKGSGARTLLESGFTDVLKPDVFVGLHVNPNYPAGSIMVKPGPANASNDFFNIRISGKGGHGAHPENCVDPVMICGYVLTQLQTIVSRENHPVYPAVVTIGSIHGGTVHNIIPDCVEMKGTLRSLTPESRKAIKEAIDRIVISCAETLRGHGEVTWEPGMPPLVNDVDVIDAIRAAGVKTIGAENVYTAGNPSLDSEDFSVLFSEVAPGAQFDVGSGNDDPSTRYGLHNSKNVFDEKCLSVGTAVIVQFTKDYLK